MSRKRHIFVSSVQRKFAAERRAVRDFVEGDALLRRFFDVFLFEDLPASSRRPDELYLAEVERSAVYATADSPVPLDLAWIETQWYRTVADGAEAGGPLLLMLAGAN